MEGFSGKQQHLLGKWLSVAALTLLLAAIGMSCGSDGCHGRLWRLPFIMWQADTTAPLAASGDALLWQLRWPRVLGAWVVGGSLGLAGALAQALFRNPLADPYLLGAASGAGLGAVLAVMGGTLAGLGASLGALAAMSISLLLAFRQVSPSSLLLAGVITGVMVAAISDLLVVTWPDMLRIRQSFFLGSTIAIDGRAVAVLAVLLVFAWLLSMRLTLPLNAQLLGPEVLQSLGVVPWHLYLALVGLIAAITGVSVAYVGLVGFVGLLAPHIAALLFRRGDHQLLLPASTVMGGGLLLLADTLARTLWAPAEMPVGTITALCGGVFLLLRLVRS